MKHNVKVKNIKFDWILNDSLRCPYSYIFIWLGGIPYWIIPCHNADARAVESHVHVQRDSFPAFVTPINVLRRDKWNVLLQPIVNWDLSN